jgi:hypothetical protein
MCYDGKTQQNYQLTLLEAKPLVDTCFKMLQKLVKCNNHLAFTQIASQLKEEESKQYCEPSQALGVLKDLQSLSHFIENDLSKAFFSKRLHSTPESRNSSLFKSHHQLQEKKSFIEQANNFTFIGSSSNTNILDKTLFSQSQEKDTMMPKAKDFIKKNKKAIAAMKSRPPSKEKLESVKSILTSRVKSLEQKRNELLDKVEATKKKQPIMKQREEFEEYCIECSEMSRKLEFYGNLLKKPALKTSTPSSIDI